VHDWHRLTRTVLRSRFASDYQRATGAAFAVSIPFCRHHDEAHRYRVVELGELYGCELCGEAWPARDVRGRFERPPKLCVACGGEQAGTRVGLLCEPCWLGAASGLRAAYMRAKRERPNSAEHRGARRALVDAAIATRSR
jgi:hypothetical protein